MKKLYVLDFHVNVGNYLGPMIWNTYPAGVELVRIPIITCDDKGADVHLIVRCEPKIGHKMCWTPCERPRNDEAPIRED